MNEQQQNIARAIVNVFETGRIRGNYSAVAVLKGDSGHLSYGRSQSTLGSGSLLGLLEAYCAQPDAACAADIKPFLESVRQKDIALDTNEAFKKLLKVAGADPVMQATQDKYFDDHYLAPACRASEALGITDALGQTVVYDSHVQGGWSKLQSRMGPVIGGDSRRWITSYVQTRADWLQHLKEPLPSTVYRMDTFEALIKSDNWDLKLPLTAHGVQITETALRAATPPAAGAHRTLILLTPYMQGEDVRALQTAFADKGLPIGKPDGFYGPFTAQLVKEWQQVHGIDETGVGPLTWKSLGL